MRAPLRACGAALALVLAVSGCGSDDGGDDPTVAAPTGGASSTPTAPASPLECPLKPETVDPPDGASTDLSAKPVVQGSSAPPPTAVQVADVVVGDGTEAQTGDTVTVKYVGAFYETGKEFDSSWSRGADKTIDYQVCFQGVVPGFSIAPLGMKTGGRRHVVIPGEFGYGEQGKGDIPPGATLVFVIDLVEVTKA